MVFMTFYGVSMKAMIEWGLMGLKGDLTVINISMFRKNPGGHPTT